MSATRPREQRKERSRQPPATFLAATLIILGFGAPLAYAQPALDVRLGFNDQFLPEQYTPIRVQITYGGQPLTGELILRQVFQSPSGPARSVEMRRTIQLGPRAQQLYVFYFPLSVHPPPEEDGPELIISLTSQGQEIAARRVPLADAARSDPFVLALSEVGFPGALPTGEQVEQIELEQLPLNWKGYAAVRRIYLGRFHSNALTPEQQEALVKWLIRGGELVVFAGENFYLQEAPWLREILPFEVEDVRFVPDLGAVAVVGQPRGEVLYREAGWPVLVRGPLGRGWVYFSAADLINLRVTTPWQRLIPERTEIPPPSTLGPELFHQRELRYPSAPLMGGLLALYVGGFGLLSLWMLRHWIEGAGRGEGRGWRVLLLLLSWALLSSGILVGYLEKPELTSRLQSLEVGLIWGTDQTPWALSQSWYSVIAKRRMTPTWTVGRDALLLPLEEASVTLVMQRTRAQMAFWPLPLSAYQPEHLYMEELVSLPVQIEMDEAQGVRAPLVRVYNQSPWTLEEAVLLRRGIYYALGDLPAGAAREVFLGDRGSGSWPVEMGRTPMTNLEGQAKQKLYAQAQAELEGRDPPWALLAWAKQESLERQPSEHRWTLKLLVIEGMSRSRG